MKAAAIVALLALSGCAHVAIGAVAAVAGAVSYGFQLDEKLIDLYLASKGKHVAPKPQATTAAVATAP